jgi:hypothetical protein
MHTLTDVVPPDRLAAWITAFDAIGAADVCGKLYEALNLRRLSAEERRYLRGPVLFQKSGWAKSVPKWVSPQIAQERYLVVFGALPGHIIGPTELLPVLMPASFDGPLTTEFARLHLWSSCHAMARHTRRSFGEIRQEMLGGVSDVPENKDVIDQEGRLHHVYEPFAWQIRRRIIANA